MRPGNPKVNGLSFSYDKEGILRTKEPSFALYLGKRTKESGKTIVDRA